MRIVFCALALDGTAVWVWAGQEEKPSSASELRASASAAKGEALFYEHACWRCHALGDKERPGLPDFQNLGPDLDSVGDRLSRPSIRESILQPSAIIAEPISEHILEPGISKMPAFEDLLSEAEVEQIVTFLSQTRSRKPSRPVDVTTETFDEEVRRAEGLVFLDFWAEWCIPCLELEPILTKLAREYAGRVKICRINVDDNPALVTEYVPDNIFPCLILMKSGKLLDRRYGTDPGMEPEPFLRGWLNEHLNRSPQTRKAGNPFSR